MHYKGLNIFNVLKKLFVKKNYSIRLILD